MVLRHLKQGIQEFHRKYVLVPADKAANNVVVVCRLNYISALKQELHDTRAYKKTDSVKISVVSSLKRITFKVLCLCESRPRQTSLVT